MTTVGGKMDESMIINQLFVMPHESDSVVSALDTTSKDVRALFLHEQSLIILSHFLDKKKLPKHFNHHQRGHMKTDCPRLNELWDSESHNVVLSRNVIFDQHWKNQHLDKNYDTERKHIIDIDDTVQDTTQSKEKKRSSPLSMTTTDIRRGLRDFDVYIMLALPVGTANDVTQSYEETFENEGWLELKKGLSAVESSDAFNLVDPSLNTEVIDL
ncbi:hypothetical protein PR048_013586, partial [Dryococelus australis]